MLDDAAINLVQERGHEIGHGVGGDGLPALHALVQLQLETRQRGHDEEVAMEVGHRFLDQVDLEVGVPVGLQQVRADHGLMKVGRHLGDEQPVVGVDVGLPILGVPAVHGVAQLVGQGIYAVQVVLVIHEDERLRAVGAAAVGAAGLPRRLVDVHPT